MTKNSGRVVTMTNTGKSISGHNRIKINFGRIFVYLAGKIASPLHSMSNIKFFREIKFQGWLPIHEKCKVYMYTLEICLLYGSLQSNL